VLTRLFILLALAVTPLYADETSAWSAIEALDAARPARTPSTPEEARSIALSIINKKEEALRQFIARYPQSPKVVEAKIRLAHLLLTKSDFAGQPHLAESATGIIDAALQTAEGSARADFLYAKITLAMRRMKLPTERDRQTLTAEVNKFRTSYPNDRRLPALLVELATLYDHQPKQKEKLLNEALERSPSTELAQRIQDDLKRVRLLGQTVRIHGAGVNGEAVDTAELRGKVVVVYFFASFSRPSLARLQAIQKIDFAQNRVAVIGVSLDRSPEAVRSMNLPWPVICDGRGWNGPLVRELGINSIPTCWVLDQKGVLRTLNARDDLESTVKALLR